MGDDNKERYINPYTDFGFKKLFGTEMNKVLQDRVFQKLFEQAEIARYSETERLQYEESKKVFWDNYSVMKTAHDKGHAEGLAEGRAEGLAEGAIETARKMKVDKVPMELISKYTGLTADEIAVL